MDVTGRKEGDELTKLFGEENMLTFQDNYIVTQDALVFILKSCQASGLSHVQQH